MTVNKLNYVYKDETSVCVRLLLKTITTIDHQKKIYFYQYRTKQIFVEESLKYILSKKKYL